MEDRNDALTASSEIVLALEKVCREHPASEVVGTVGRMDISPNAANIIPDKVQFIVEIRGKSREEIQEVITAWEKLHIGHRAGDAAQLYSERSCWINLRRLWMTKLSESLQEQAHSLGYPYHLLGSMAGHDAAHMASITRSGMLFVPSIGGKSHCPDEESRMEDIEKAANVLLHTILELDQRLDR